MRTVIQDAHEDSRLTTFLQKELSEINRQGNHARQFKAKRLCGSQRNLKTSPAVFLLTNGAKSYYYGLNRCNSSWGCPTCTPRRMAQYGTRIAAMIDALKAKYKQSACMITFTVPHRKWMNINDIYQILQDTWREYSRQYRTSRTKKYTLKKNVDEDKRAVGKKGETREYEIKLSNTSYAALREKFQIVHNVRVYEFTWGPNGWHPHIHALFWIPEHLFDQLNLSWSKTLSDEWLNTCKKIMYKHYVKKNPDNAEKIKGIVDELFNERQYKHRAVYFSADNNGKILRVKSSHYISGWGGDMEVCNERKMKRAAEGHYSPLQILQEAYKHRKDKDATEKNYWLNLYLDFIKVTFGHRRVQFSKSGLNKIAADWMQTNTWQEVLKKKFTDAGTDTRKVVYWFCDEQWQQISFHHLSTKLLDLSLLPDAKEQIEHLLLEYDIQWTTTKHWFEKFLENITSIDYFDGLGKKLLMQSAG